MSLLAGDNDNIWFGTDDLKNFFTAAPAISQVIFQSILTQLELCRGGI